MNVTRELLIDAIVGGFNISQFKTESCDLLLKSGYVNALPSRRCRIDDNVGGVCNFIWNRSTLEREPFGVLLNLYDFVKNNENGAEAVIHMQLRAIDCKKPVEKIHLPDRQDDVKSERLKIIREFVYSHAPDQINLSDRNSTINYLLELPETIIIDYPPLYVHTVKVPCNDGCDRIFQSKKYSWLNNNEDDN